MLQVSAWFVGVALAGLAWLLRQYIPPPWVAWFLEANRHFPIGWLFAFVITTVGVLGWKVRAVIQDRHGYDPMRLPRSLAQLRKAVLIIRATVVPWMWAWAYWNFQFYEPNWLIWSESFILGLTTLMLIPELPEEIGDLIHRKIPQIPKGAAKMLELLRRLFGKRRLSHHRKNRGSTQLSPQPGTAVATTTHNSTTLLDPSALFSDTNDWLDQRLRTEGHDEQPRQTSDTPIDIATLRAAAARKLFKMDLPKPGTYRMVRALPMLLRTLRTLRNTVWAAIHEVRNEVHRQEMAPHSNMHVDGTPMGDMRGEKVEAALATDELRVKELAREARDVAGHFIEAVLLLDLLCDSQDSYEGDDRRIADQREADRKLAMLASSPLTDDDQLIALILQLGPRQTPLRPPKSQPQQLEGPKVPRLLVVPGTPDEQRATGTTT